MSGAAGVTELLDDLAVACRVLGREGHDDMNLGHIAGRDPQGRGFWLKRSGVSLSEVEGQDDFVLLDFDGAQLAGEGGRHYEWPIHAAILLARPDVNATGHTHCRPVQLLSAVDEELLLLVNESAPFHGGVPRYGDTCDLITTMERGHDVARALASRRAVLLANHGGAYAGSSVPELLMTALYLQRAAASQIELASTGWAPAPAHREDAAAKASRTFGAEAISSFWAYYRRQDDARGGR